MIDRAHWILFVADQARSSAFYAAVLDRPATLDVPGMTEFFLLDGVVLGLMPSRGIHRLLAPALRDPADGDGVPRCELYLLVEDVEARHAAALQAGATELSPPAQRGWGHVVGYSRDPDGHVLAFARSGR